MRKFLRVIAYGRPYIFRMALGLACVISVAMLGLLVPQIIRFVIDQVLAGKPLHIHPITLHPFGHSVTYNSEQWLGFILLALISLYVVRGLLAFARTYLLSWVGQRVLFDLRNQIFTRLQELPLRFYETRGTGQIMARITGDVDAVGGMMTSSTVDLLTYLVMVVAIATILIRTHWQLALMSFIFLPLFAISYQSFIRRIMGYYRHLRRQWSELYGDLHESIAGAQVVKAFSQEKYEARQIFRGFRETYGTNIILARLGTLMGAISELIAASGTAFILWYGGRAALHGELTTGQVIAFYTYLGQLYGPIVTLMNMNDVIQRSLISADRVFDILDAKSTVQDAPNAYPLPTVTGTVRFDHVFFGYDPEKMVLEDIDFEAQPGQMIALVGPSGSGKTTIANLLPRFYDPKEGRILIDGHDISRVTLRSLRNQIGIVLQENVLFSGSVKDNLRYGKMDATDQEIVEAAIAANAHDFIVSELSEGYDTEVRERGVRLSGGQKQRIAIARAILRDPRILILDEATSSLDSEAEAQIQEAMERLLQGRTTFVIAHRLSTVMKAHRIIVLESGRIIESGTHDELVAAGGRYAQMYRKQFKVEEKEEAWLK